MMIIPIGQLINNIVYILVYIQATYLLMGKNLELDVFLTFVLYGQIFISQLKYLGKSLRLVELSYGSFIRIYELLSLQDSEICDSEHIEIKGELEFKNISYEEDGHIIMDNVNFVIGENSKTLIRENVLSSKRKFIDMLTKFDKPSSGEILIDGINIDDISMENLQDYCCFITQDNQI